ncbi:OmpA family protein [Flavobacterium jejuense]|uniref:OmpA family protein n=1 Tax=Flavobacterium jejuense TaxID=1544455 RepID=A0ABX0IUH3_9FLAO|nr:OmpA family protein [Flavobacterium jejuense]NHN27560.1 OmpA family protein [Flavobacterium jejuense]
MKKISIFIVTGILLSSCVSKKKYVALEKENGEVKNQLQKVQVEKESLDAKFSEIQSRVDNYNSKINSLTEETNAKLVTVGGDIVISNNVRNKMEATLKNVNQNELSQAKTLKDSMNLAVSYNLRKSLKESNMSEDNDISVNINETVVMITISDELLFNSGSYQISNKADKILKKIAEVINSDESLDIMVEGHTDDRKIVGGSSLKDNWDLSVLRATSVVRKLEKNFNVAPEKLIASGRSYHQPLVLNDSKANRASNRRTRIIILPNIDKFFALMSDSDASDSALEVN